MTLHLFCLMFIYASVSLLYRTAVIHQSNVTFYRSNVTFDKSHVTSISRCRTLEISASRCRAYLRPVTISIQMP